MVAREGYGIDPWILYPAGGRFRFFGRGGILGRKDTSNLLPRQGRDKTPMKGKPSLPPSAPPAW
jgi:hypothetical protein